MGRVIRTLVCGYGSWGARLADRILEHDKYFLAGIVDPSATRRAIATMMNIEAYASLEDAIDAEKPELVIVATPISESVEACVTSATRYAHVIAAKPCATTTSGADRVLRVFAEKDRRLIVDYTLLVAPKWQLAKERVAKLGCVQHVFATRTTSLDRSSQDVLTDLCVHDLSLLVDLDDATEWSVASTMRDSVSASVALSSSTGAFAKVVAARSVGPQSRMIRIICDEGAVTWDQTRDTLVTHTQTGVPEYVAPDQTDLITRRLDDAYDQIRDRRVVSTRVFETVTRLLEDAETETARAAA